ncbi:MAG: short-chain dehydrogenase [Bacillota bacterium]|nr:MAG: short-chain dehydrogenase [Bacillota bacterium]
MHAEGVAQKPHALVVGGTGMLRGASLGLAARGYIVSVVARGRSRLDALVRDAAGRAGSIHPVAVDYRDTGALANALADARSRFGPIELAVVWVHSVAPAAPLAVARLVGTPEHPGRFFHVLGSATADPSRPDPRRRATFASFPNIRYREVILGFVVDGRRSRWLTHEEISAGVLAAVDADRPRFIVGTVEPWDLRP